MRETAPSSGLPRAQALDANGTPASIVASHTIPCLIVVIEIDPSRFANENPERADRSLKMTTNANTTSEM